MIFIPQPIVSDMIGLIRNDGNILEPSAGDGAFVSQLLLKLNSKKRRTKVTAQITAIEYDKKFAKKRFY